MKRVIELGEMRARDLMVPRPTVVGLEVESSVESVHRVVRESRHSHYPVCRGGLDDVVGVVHIKDLIGMDASSGAAFPFDGIMSEPTFIPETSPLPQLLDLFRHRESHVAFVVDEFGSMQGLITLSDVVERLLGQRAGTGGGVSEEAVRRGDGSWLIDGRMNLREAFSILGIDDEQHTTHASISTVAGLVIAQLGHIPVTAERVTFAHHRFEVVDMDGARIDKVLVTRLDAPAPGAN
ncbi:hemolysin family protein [Nodularia spumigena]|uniref:hemolysin family protein n=1 Tax=Nodularia spumigena TaxID=70799 RepID=UPI003969BF78